MPLALKIGIGVLAFLFLVAVYFMVTNSRASTEILPYSVLTHDGAFEVREYPPFHVVRSPMSDREGEGDGAFGRLFQYISGSNQDQQKIAMTAPVLMDRRAEKSSMEFVIPASVSNAGGVPQPLDSGLEVVAMPGGKVACHRFKGRQSPENEARALKAIRAWLEARQLTADGEPCFAYYDPPWTPVPLRRNEVWIRIGQVR